MSGCWVIVCGPSGAGKDSVMGWARDALAGRPWLHFARRLVTRAGSSAWDDEVNAKRLELLRAGGALAWYWEAHGLRYGIDANYAVLVRAGQVVVVNGSREHARTVAGRGDVHCVLVTAPQAVLAARLRARGRENEEAIARRLARGAGEGKLAVDHIIRNEGELAAAGVALRDYLLELAP